jgi:hypothetical protein
MLPRPPEDLVRKLIPLAEIFVAALVIILFILAVAAILRISSG